MKIIDNATTVRTTDVIHIYDSDKKLNWFIRFEKTNGIFTGAREMMNYENFKSLGGDYMQKVYDLAYTKISK